MPLPLEIGGSAELGHAGISEQGAWYPPDVRHEGKVAQCRSSRYASRAQRAILRSESKPPEIVSRNDSAKPPAGGCPPAAAAYALSPADTPCAKASPNATLWLLRRNGIGERGICEFKRIEQTGPATLCGRRVRRFPGTRRRLGICNTYLDNDSAASLAKEQDVVALDAGTVPSRNCLEWRNTDIESGNRNEHRHSVQWKGVRHTSDTVGERKRMPSRERLVPAGQSPSAVVSATGWSASTPVIGSLPHSKQRPAPGRLHLCGSNPRESSFTPSGCSSPLGDTLPVERLPVILEFFADCPPWFSVAPCWPPSPGA